jgi:hypothetical protein
MFGGVDVATRIDVDSAEQPERQKETRCDGAIGVDEVQPGWKR